jgi:PKD repeat protein
VQFLASATDPSPTDTAAGFTYLWTFGDGSSATGQAVNHTYAAAGTYSVTLRATDKDGGSNTTTRQVVVSQGTPAPVGSFIVTAHDRIPNFGANPTVTAAASGNWSNPATWSTGQVPVAGDVVSIGAGRLVTYDVVSDVQVRTVAVQSGGSLRFRTDINTRLVVLNLLVMEGGELQIGTQANPVQASVKAEVFFANVPINTAADPEQWGNGLIALGKVAMHGAVKTDTFIRLASEPLAGATTLALSAPAAGWRVGDRLVLPDTRQMYWEISPDNAAANYASQRETLTIAAISADGHTVTLNQPLAYSHKGARDGNGVLDFLPHVANITRNVTIRSQSATGYRGHTVFTGRADVDIRYAQFSGLGRTTFNPLDNTTFDAFGNPAHIGTNQTARYSVNFHHLVGPTTPQANGHQFTFQGNSVFCPIDPMTFRWGIALHDSSYGLIKDNVLFNWAGGGIVADTGSEVYNVIEGNLVTRTTQYSPWMPRADQRGIGGDFAFEGSAFWFRGYLNYVRDNVASESRIGFTYFSFGEPTARIPIAQGADPSMPGQYQTVHVMRQSILQFERNEAYGGWTNIGLTIWCMGAQANIVNANQAESVVKDFRAWHVYEKAYYNYDTMRLTFDGLVIRGEWSLMHNGGGGALGLYAGDYQARHYKIINSDIQGVGIGFDAGVTVNTTTLIENTFIRCYVGVRVRPMYSTGGAPSVSPRNIELRDVEFMHLNVPDIGGWETPRKFIAMDGNPVADSTNYIVSDTVYVYGFNGVPTDNFRLYYNEQAGDHVLPVTTYYPGGAVLSLGAPVPGVTNAQGMAQYGIAFAGSIAPPNAAGRANIIGRAVAVPG